MRVRRHKRPEPALITGAPPNPQAEFDYRRRRYTITMGIRIVCLILAAVTYHIIWLWPIFAAGAIVLPWIAVVLANDRLPRQSSRFQRYAGAAPAIESTDDQRAGSVGGDADGRQRAGSVGGDADDQAHHR